MPLVILVADKGLSPRVRGNLGALQKHYGGTGSIPACAGEPRSIGCNRHLT